MTKGSNHYRKRTAAAPSNRLLEADGPVELEAGDEEESLDSPIETGVGSVAVIATEAGRAGFGEAEDGERRFGVVAPERHGERIDRWLVSLAPEFSRTYLQQLVCDGLVRVGGQVQTSASRRVLAGQPVEVVLRPTAQSTAFRAEPALLPLPIVHEDEDVLVIDKPAGLVVHPAAGNWSGTLLNALLAHHAGAAALPRAGIVHRLDKDTSGLMVVAKTLTAQTALVRAIAAHEVRREYLALAHGRHAPGWITIDRPIGRDPVSRVRMAVAASGKPARTDAECLAEFGPAASPAAERSAQGWVSAWRCRLHTGRTHQIRVHLASIGHPLLADSLYGGTSALGLRRQALHAVRLAFEHPRRGGLRVFSAALPPDLKAAWEQVAPGLAQAAATMP